MSINRISMSRAALPQTSAQWEQLAARGMASLAKIPLSRWQFLVRLILIFILSFSAARLFWLLLPNPTLPPATVAIAVAKPVAIEGGSSVNVEQLKSLAVFGKADAPAAAVDTPNPEAQATVSSLNLLLMGLIASNDESIARAIITAGDKTDVYAIGNSLPVGNGVTLAKIMSDRVIVNNNGQFESLMLYQDNPNAVPISQAYIPPPAVAAERPMQAVNPSPVGTDKSPGYDAPERSLATGPGMGEVSRNLSDVVAMSIYREGGQVVGYKIRPGRDAEKFKTLGLQTDDIVTAVNGMPLTNPAKIMEVYKSMGNTTSASLEIKRGGSVMTVDVVLQ